MSALTECPPARAMLSNISGTPLWNVWLLPMNSTCISYWAGSPPITEQAVMNRDRLNARNDLVTVFIYLVYSTHAFTVISWWENKSHAACLIGYLNPSPVNTRLDYPSSAGRLDHSRLVPHRTLCGFNIEGLVEENEGMLARPRGEGNHRQRGFGTGRKSLLSLGNFVCVGR